MKILIPFLLIFSLISCQNPSESAQDSSLQEVRELSTVNSEDGTPIAYRLAGQGETAVIFVHGWCIDGSYFQSQLDHLQDRYQVVAIDLAGHGASGQTRTDWSIENFAKDVKAVVDELGLQKIVLVGHSMGDMVVTESANLMPERVIGLIGIDTFIEPTSESDSAEFEGFYQGLAEDFPGLTRAWISTLFYEGTDPVIIQAILDDMAQGPASACLGSFQAIHNYLHNGHFTEAIGELNVPIRAINASIPDTLAWREAGVDFEVLAMSGVGHYPMKENPDALNVLLDQVLGEFAETK